MLTDWKIHADKICKPRNNKRLLEVISGAFETNSIQAFYDVYSALTILSSLILQCLQPKVAD